MKFVSSSFVAALATGLALVAAPQAQAQSQTPIQTQAQDRIYGSQLMTPQERIAYQQNMRALATQAERDQARTDHHTAMQARATERGVTLPAEPQTQGKATGPRSSTPGAGTGQQAGGQGGGQGNGQGGGQGGGRGR